MVRTLTQAAAAAAVVAVEAARCRHITPRVHCLPPSFLVLLLAAIRVVELYSRPQNCSGSQRRGFFEAEAAAVQPRHIG